MIIDETQYLNYGLTPIMQEYVKAGLIDLKNYHIIDVLRIISQSEYLTQDDKNIIIFEIGRKYGSGYNDGR